MTEKRALFGLEFASPLVCDNVQKRHYLAELVANGLRGRCGGIILTKDADELIREAAQKAGTHSNSQQSHLLDCGVTQTSAVFVNPFTYADVAGIASLLHSLMASPSDFDRNGVFRKRAEQLIDAMAPVLEWLRDAKGLELTPNTVSQCFSFQSLCAIAREASLKFCDGESFSREINLQREMPESLKLSVCGYLTEVPRYDPWQLPDSAANQKARTQHSFSLYYFTTQLATLHEFAGGLFKSTGSSLDLKEVFRQRSMVVVNVPYLTENPSINEAFGKLLIASLHNAAFAFAHERFEELVGELIDMVPGPFHAATKKPMFVIIDGFEANLDLQLRRVALAATGEKIHFAAAVAGEGTLWFGQRSDKQQFLEMAES